MSRDFLNKAFEKATWVGFDLDDTLHDFRSASANAIDEVLNIIYRFHQIEVEKLRSEYRDVIHTGTANAFTDGKTSHEYRAERFTALLNRFDLPREDDFVGSLVSAYEDKLSRSLKLKDGARELLDSLRSQGKKIMVITEGPQDAQERTVNQLLGGKVDNLITTNKIGVSKVDGLFPKVLEKLDILPSQLVYVGDSLDRDVVPAQKAGIAAVHFDEKGLQSKDQASYTIGRLSDLSEILGTTKF